MGKIKKILENELVGGTQSTDVYPVTSTKAVYNEDNENLDSILKRRGVVNISTNYNSEHTAEVLTLEQAIVKVPSKDRVLGFQGRFLTSDGWKSYVFDGDSLSNWFDVNKWTELISSAGLAQELGDSTSKAISQNAVTKALKDSSEEINNKITELENKNIYFENCPFIKEAYITDERFTKILWIRKNYGEQQNINAITICDEEESLNCILTKTGEYPEGVQALKYASKTIGYIVIDWNDKSIKENVNNLIRGQIRPCTRNLDYSPSIKEYVNRLVVEENIIDSENPIASKAVLELKNSQEKIDNKIKYPTEFVEGVSNYIKELYIDSEEVKYLWFLRNHSSGKYQIAFAKDSSGTGASLWSGETTNYYDDEIIKFKLGNTNIYFKIDFSKIPDNTVVVMQKALLEKSYDLSYSPSIASYINTSEINKIKESSSIDEYFIEKYNKTAISWVDDDFNTTSVEKVKNICDELGCKCDFAVIPSERNGIGEYPTDSEYYFSEEILSLIKEYEELGFHIEMHPIHKGWYGGNYQGKEYVQKLLVKTIRVFKDNNILTSNCIIYPGASADNTDVVNVCKSWLDYGITAGIYNPNNGIYNKFKLKRTFIQLDSTHTKTWYKQKVDEAVTNGSWLIFGTHSYEFDDSGTIDETTMSFANLKEIIQYANTKCSIKPVSEIFSERSPMLDLYIE